MMNTTLRFALVGYTLLFLGGIALAQEEDGDSIFDEGAFDTSVTESKDQAKNTQLEYLFGITLLADGTVQVPLDRWGYSGQGTYGGIAFIKATKPETGALFASWSFRQVLTAGTNDSFFATGYSFQKIDPSRLDLALSELHLSFDMNKMVFFRLGNQLLSWGSTLYWSPADFVNRQKQAFGAGADLRSGIPGFRVHLPLDNSNLFLFLDLSRVVDKTVVGDFAQMTGLAWRGDTTVVGIRLGTNGYFIPGVVSLGLDVTTNILGADLYAEGALKIPEIGDKTGQVALGFSRPWGDSGEWSLTAEAFWNPTGEGAVDIPFFSSPAYGNYSPLYWGRYYVWSQFKRSKLWDDRLSLSVSGVTNLSDSSWKGSVHSDWILKGLPSFSVIGSLTGGDPQREFTHATGGSVWSLALRSILSF